MCLRCCCLRSPVTGPVRRLRRLQHRQSRRRLWGICIYTSGMTIEVTTADVCCWSNGNCIGMDHLLMLPGSDCDPNWLALRAQLGRYEMARPVIGRCMLSPWLPVRP